MYSGRDRYNVPIWDKHENGERLITKAKGALCGVGLVIKYRGLPAVDINDEWINLYVRHMMQHYKHEYRHRTSEANKQS